MEQHAMTHADTLHGETLHAETQHAPKVSPQLNPESFASQLFWLTLTFAALYLLVSRSAMPVIQSVLETRRAKIADDLEAAEKLSQQALEAQMAYEKVEAQARLNADAAITEMQTMLEANAKTQHAALDVTLSKKLAEADKALREQCTRIERDLVPIAEEAAAMIIEKLLGQSADNALVKKAVKAASS